MAPRAIQLSTTVIPSGRIKIVFLFVPPLFKNLSKVELWSQVQPILKNGKTELTDLPYFILTDKNLQGECTIGAGSEIVC